MFYQLKSDIYAESGITEEPSLPGFEGSFSDGTRITEKLPQPLVFDSSFTRDDPPRSFVGLSIPVWSSDLVDLFRRIGVDNFECFEATIKGVGPSAEWNGYFAANILGAVAAADMSKSKYMEIMRSPGGTPFVVFQELVLDGKKARPFELFRLAENMGTIVVSERVIEALKKNPRAGGWGITALPMEES